MRNIDISKYANTEELYTEHHKKFNLRWVLFSVFLAVFCLLLVSALMEFTINKNNYLLNYQSIISEANKNLQPSDAIMGATQYYQRTLILSVMQVLISLSLFIWHMISYLKSIRKRDFSNYSFWLSTLYSFVITFLIINLIFSIGGIFRIQPWNINKILNTAYFFILPIGYFTLYYPCSKIIKMFRYVKAQEQIRKLGLNNNPMNMFSQFFANNQMNVTPKQEDMEEKDSNKDISSTEENKNNNSNNYQSQLETLDDEKLTLMAQKLNIFGANELSRDELIKKIILIFENKDSSNEDSKKDTIETKEKSNIKEENEETKEDNNNQEAN